jgi:hypothetical protein
VRVDPADRRVDRDLEQERRMFRQFLAAVLAAAGASAWAQAGSSGPPIDYRSAFAGYRAWSAQPLRDWREVNDEVERLGGHAGHLRASPDAAVAKPSTPPATGQPVQQSGHGHHGLFKAEPKR